MTGAALGLCLLLTAVPPPTKRVAVFPVAVKGRVDAVVVEQVQHFLDAGPSTSVELVVMSGGVLGRALAGSPQKALAKCERAKRFDQCLARVAADLQVDEVVAARIAATSSGTRLIVLAVTPSAKVELRLDVTGVTLAKVSSVLAPEPLAKAFGVPYLDPNAPPPAQEVPPGALDPSALQRLEPLPPLPPMDPLAGPVYTRPPPPAESSSSALSWIGWGLTGVGAATAGAGGYFAMQSTTAARAKPSTATTQRDAVARYDRADTQRDRANLLFEVGGGAVVTGALCLLIDTLSD